MLKYSVLCLMFVSVMALDSLDVSDYEYVTEPKNWYQANEYCKRNGMELLDINTDQEYDIITKIIGNNTRKCLWTSGNDLAEQGTWVWMSSGERINNIVLTEDSSDIPLEPEDCLELRGCNLLYNDAECTKLCNFMCEKKSKVYFQFPSVIPVDVETDKN